jgi:hypothetical protein
MESIRCRHPVVQVSSTHVPGFDPEPEVAEHVHERFPLFDPFDLDAKTLSADLDNGFTVLQLGQAVQAAPDA